MEWIKVTPKTKLNKEEKERFLVLIGKDLFITYYDPVNGKDYYVEAPHDSDGWHNQDKFDYYLTLPPLPEDSLTKPSK
jgi:hypothetical protein